MAENALGRFEGVGDVNYAALGRQLTDFLICQLCHHPVYPIIRGCQKGHFVCAYCQHKLDDNKCGLCKTKLIAHNALTKIIRNSKLKWECRFKKEGCAMKDAPYELAAEHETMCEYRPFKCGFTKKCQESKNGISFTEICQHLKLHFIPFSVAVPVPASIVTLDQEISFKFTRVDFERVIPSKMELRGRIFKCNQMIYGLRVSVQNDEIQMWVFSFNKMLDITGGFCTIKVKGECKTKMSPPEVTFQNVPVLGIRAHTHDYISGWFSRFARIRHEQFEVDDSLIVSVIIIHQ